ncbi:Crp/Fnr family transcriptional regulator [Gulbenkiania mobilis]|uniref:Crp/Fnr family transcriptional regulator n=1 Tax=Gulbenkiania mobilis TaxID=397457 RepID=UPI0009FA56E3|nr:Crp/Fnr family transcriptional regulator [Gulbenkiania mobilis]
MIPSRLLALVPLFSTLPAAELEWLSQRSSCVHHEKNALVVEKNAASSELLFLLTGRLLVVDRTPEGQEVGLHVIQAGEYFGELSAVDGLPRAASVRALEASQVGCLAREDFQALMIRAPDIMRTVLERFALAIRANNKRRVILSLSNVQRRVAAVLLTYSAPDGLGQKTLVIRQLPPQHELAALANTSRESVSRVLRSLMEQGLIVREGRALLIPDPSAMDRLIQTPELAATQ